MVPSNGQHTSEKVNEALRKVIDGYRGQSVSLATHLPGTRRSHDEGEVVEASTSGFLLQRPNRAGRSYFAYTDLFAGHVEVRSPATLAEDLADALAHMGVHHRGHRTPVDGRFGARVPVGPSASGISRAKTLVG